MHRYVALILVTIVFFSYCTPGLAQFNGSYDIGGGAYHYADLVTAMYWLATLGMIGPVTFNVYNGTYDGQVNIPYGIPGLSAYNTLTLQNAPGHSPVVTSTLGHGFYLLGADYVTIRGFEVTNCLYNGIYYANLETNLAVHNRILDNYVHHVNYGNPNYFAVILVGCEDCEVTGNEIGYTGISIGLAACSRTLIANNMIYNIGPGIYLDGHLGGTQTNHIYFNSVYVETNYAIHLVNPLHDRVFYNIFYQGSTGSYYAYGLWRSSPTGYPLYSNHNDIYAPNASVGWYNGTYHQTLSDWYVATYLDGSSISANPLFLSTSAPFNLHIDTSVLSPVDGAAHPTTLVPVDFDGNPRHPVSPDIGADEFAYYWVSLIPETQTNYTNAGDTTDFIIYIENCNFEDDVYDLSLSVTGESWTHTIYDAVGSSIIDSIAVSATSVDSFIVRVIVDSSAAYREESYGQIVAQSRYGTARYVLSDMCSTTTIVPLFIQIPYDWIEIAYPAGGPGTNAEVYEDDQNVGPINIGFPFPYFGCDLFNSIRVCSNGWASFTSTGVSVDPLGSFYNAVIPSTYEPNNLIAPYWDDLNPSAGGSVWFYGNFTFGKFIVEWYQVPRYSTGGSYTFQSILYPDGIIDFQYHTITHGSPNSCAAGIENANGTQGSQCTYHGSGPLEPQSGMGVRFHPVCNAQDFFVELSPNSYATVQIGDSVDYQIEIYNHRLHNDTYDLSLNITGRPWRTEIWDHSLTAQIDSIAVLPFSTETFYIRVVVPDTANLEQSNSSRAEIVAMSRYGESPGILSDTTSTATIVWAPIALPYTETFDSSHGNYYPTGLWEWGNPTHIPDSACSEPYCWGTDLDGPYPNYSCSQLVSPPITLEGLPILSFCQFRHAYANWNGGNVKISADGGLNWQLLLPEGGYNGQVSQESINCLTPEPVYTGAGTSWETVTFDLSEFSPDTVHLMWEFGTGQSSLGGYGWYVDNIEITGIENYCVFLSPETFTHLVQASDTADFAFQIYNCGIEDDVYDLSVTIEGQLWQTEIWNSSFTSQINSIALNSLDIDSFMVRVIASPEALIGDSSIAEIVANSRFGSFRNRLADTSYAAIFVLPFAEIPYNWVEIAGPAGGSGINAGITGDNQIAGPFPIGFTFPYYHCYTHESIWVSSNGNAPFYNAYPFDSVNTSIPHTTDPNHMLAPYWDDLRPNSGSVWYYYDAANDRFIMEWYQFTDIYQDGGNYTFELILYPNSSTEFMYHTIEPLIPDSCTIGIENYYGTEGFQATYNGSGPFQPSSGTGLRFPPVCAPPEQIEDLVISLRGDTLAPHVVLTWSSNMTHHNIYKSTIDPQSGFMLIGSTADTTYLDTNAVIDETKSFYYITADSE